MYRDFGKDVEFVVVYIREVHPNRVINGEKIPQPSTYKQRVGIATTMCTKLDISIPTVIDGMDNKVGTAYAGFPDRLYLVGRDGKIAFKGPRGPFGFKPSDLEDAIRKELGQKTASAKKSDKNSAKKSDKKK